jgi:hypothetical protein
MKLTPIALFSLLTVILLSSVVIGHFLPPTGILFIPFVISVATAIIVFTDSGFNVLLKSILCYLFIGLNDIGIKLFAGGRHDMEGIGWVYLLLFIGLVPCSTMLVMAVIRDKRSATWLKLMSVISFTLLIWLHLEVVSLLLPPFAMN